jgi:hypothetical protein
MTPNVHMRRSLQACKKQTSSYMLELSLHRTALQAETIATIHQHAHTLLLTTARARLLLLLALLLQLLLLQLLPTTTHVSDVQHISTTVETSQCMPLCIMYHTLRNAIRLQTLLSLL